MHYVRRESSLSLYSVFHYTTSYDLLQGLKAQHVLPPYGA